MKGSFLVVDDSIANGFTVSAMIARMQEAGLSPNMRVFVRVALQIRNVKSE